MGTLGEDIRLLVPSPATALGAAVLVLPVVVAVEVLSLPSDPGHFLALAVAGSTWLVLATVGLGSGAVEDRIAPERSRRGVAGLLQVVAGTVVVVVALRVFATLVSRTVTLLLAGVVGVVGGGTNLGSAVLALQVVGSLLVVLASIGLLGVLASVQFVPAAVLLDDRPLPGAVVVNARHLARGQGLVAGFDALVLLAVVATLYPAGILQFGWGAPEAPPVPPAFVPAWLLIAGTASLAVLAPVYVGLYRTTGPG